MKIAINEVRVVVPNLSLGQILPLNPRRIGFMVSCVTGFVATVTTRADAVTNQGFVVGGNSNTVLQVLGPDFRELCGRQWFGNNLGGASSLAFSVVELLESGYIDAAIVLGVGHENGTIQPTRNGGSGIGAIVGSGPEQGSIDISGPIRQSLLSRIWSSRRS